MHQNLERSRRPALKHFCKNTGFGYISPIGFQRPAVLISIHVFDARFV